MRNLSERNEYDLVEEKIKQIRDECKYSERKIETQRKKTTSVSDLSNFARVNPWKEQNALGMTSLY